jgi:hypothetical protein
MPAQKVECGAEGLNVGAKENLVILRRALFARRRTYAFLPALSTPPANA